MHPSISHSQPHSKNILLVVDYNTEDTSKFKIEQSIPTIQYILQRNPRTLFIVTHLGRPKSRNEHSTIHFMQTLTNIVPRIEYKEIRNYKGEEGIFFGDNLRHYKKEELSTFEKYFDFSVNDSFGTWHREEQFNCKYIGLLMEKEISVLDTVHECDLVVMGGSKMKDKLKLVNGFGKNTKIFLGGGLCNSVYKKQGYEIGKDTLSIKEEFSINREVILPEDFKVINKQGECINKNINGIEPTDVIVDIGTNSIDKLLDLIDKSSFMLWNGPLGKMEESTKRIIDKVKEGKIKAVIGGGETVSLLMKYSDGKGIYHISTGGGSLLSYLTRKSQ